MNDASTRKNFRQLLIKFDVLFGAEVLYLREAREVLRIEWLRVNGEVRGRISEASIVLDELVPDITAFSKVFPGRSSGARTCNVDNGAYSISPHGAGAAEPSLELLVN